MIETRTLKRGAATPKSGAGIVAAASSRHQHPLRDVRRTPGQRAGDGPSAPPPEVPRELGLRGAALRVCGLCRVKKGAAAGGKGDDDDDDDDDDVDDDG